MKTMMNSAAVAALVGSAMVRSVTIEELNANRGAPLRRSVAVRNIDEEARTVEVAFSSETPVRRWFGDEILDHSAGSMIMDRLDDGAAVLWNHDTDIQIGVVENGRVDGDRVGRALLRFGTSARAEEIWRDVVAGVIRHISFGYFIREIKTTEREGEPDEVRVTSFEPYEISFVSVPADPSVGVGRSAGGEPPEDQRTAPANTNGENDELNRDQSEGSGLMERILRAANGDLVRANVDADGNIVDVIEVLERAAATQELVTRGQAAEQTRTADILEIAETYSVQRLAADAIRDGVTVDAFTRSVLEAVTSGNGSGNTQGGNRALDDDAGVIGMTDGEVNRFSFLRALRALANPTDRSAQEAAAFEFEASAAAAVSSGRDAQGIMVPADVLRRSLNTGTDGAAAGDTGGYAIATDLMSQSFIEMLRNSSILLPMGTPMGGLVGDVSIPGQSSGATGYWLGEDDEASEGTQDLRQLGLSPKTAGAFSEVTRKMLMQSSIDSELLMRRDLARALGLTMDKAGYYGAGTANQPLGIANLDGISVVPFATAGKPTFAELVQMETEVAAANADVASMAYIGSAGFRGHCKTTEKFAGSSGATLWESGGTVNGYSAEITNQVNTGDVFHGNFADLVVAMWGGLDLTVDPYSNSKRGRVRIVAFQDIDFAHRNIESFTLGRAA